ncbi:hypothetical protein NDU88_006194 [Pleurodeles waltl]|uniref:Uncharacterized protein n=1 Tax=Pleurodeles waltl TaxID=8319 RepID=A0AAV7TCW7_PLEWA|nr:hypothetical protein NDU88_006194 [Pleurodeles waltl]
MWAFIIFVTPGFRVREVTDEQLFRKYPGASEIVFADLVKVRVELRNEAPSPIEVLITEPDQDLSLDPLQLLIRGPNNVGLINTAKPLRITLREGDILPRVHHYCLPKKADE